MEHRIGISPDTCVSMIRGTPAATATTRSKMAYFIHTALLNSLEQNTYQPAFFARQVL